MNNPYEDRINWKNKVEGGTALCENLLNRMDLAMYNTGKNLIFLDTSKLDLAVANEMVAGVTFNPQNGVFTITKLNGSTVEYDTAVEKIAINFKYDSTTQRLVLTLADGTTQEIDLRALITQNEFKDSDTIRFIINPDGEVIADIIEGSITDRHIKPNYLADLKEQALLSAAAAGSAQAYSETAVEAGIKAQSYTKGDTNSRPGEMTDNASFYYEEVKKTEAVLYSNAVHATEAAEAAAINAETAAAEANAATDTATKAADKAAEAAEKAEQAVSGEGFAMAKDVGNKADLATANKENIVDAVNEINAGLDETKKSVGNGKTQIAAAITRKKVATAATDTFEVMAGKIDKIKLGSGNATPDKVLQGTTFTGDSGVEQTGTMPNIGLLTEDAYTYVVGADLRLRIPCGAYLHSLQSTSNGFGLTDVHTALHKVAGATGITADKIAYRQSACGVNGSFTGDGTIAPDKVLTGYKGYSKGEAVNGSMPANNPVTDPTEVRAAANVQELRIRYPYGYYPRELYGGNYYDPYVRAPYSSVASALNITSDKIINGQSICGVSGNGGYKFKKITQSVPTETYAAIKEGTWTTVNRCTGSLTNGYVLEYPTWKINLGLVGLKNTDKIVFISARVDPCGGMRIRRYADSAGTYWTYIRELGGMFIYHPDYPTYTTTKFDNSSTSTTNDVGELELKYKDLVFQLGWLSYKTTFSSTTGNLTGETAGTFTAQLNKNVIDVELFIFYE